MREQMLRLSASRVSCLGVFVGDAAWFEPGRFPLPIQTSRIFLYSGYFLVGVGIGAMDLESGIFAENGELAARW